MPRTRLHDWKSDRLEYAGQVFYRMRSGHYCDRKGRPLHRVVWANHHGPIPPGYDVHHVDDDKRTVDVGKLELMLASEHSRHHAQQNRAALRECLLRGQMKAIAQRQTPEGRASHALGATIMWAGRPQQKRLCVVCGFLFSTKATWGKQDVCSETCRTKRYNQEQRYHVVRTCGWCGEEFSTTKYKQYKTCSKTCRYNLRDLKIKTNAA
jgi:hypothetical protein